MNREGPNVICEDVLKSDAQEIEKAHDLWLSKLPPQYCAIHKEEQLNLEVNKSIDRVKSVNLDLRYSLSETELASTHWRFYFIGKCTECKQIEIASEISKLYQDSSFENFKCDEEDLKNIVERAKSYAQNPLGFLLFQGGIGTGKTHLAVSILRETPLSFNYVSHLDLIQEYRNFHYNRPNTKEENYNSIEIFAPPERYEILQDSSLLCVDDFGWVKHSRDEALITFEFLDYRIQKLLPTILLTNYTKKQLEEIIDPRLLDRIEQALSENLQFGLPSKRKSMNSQYLERASK